MLKSHHEELAVNLQNIACSTRESFSLLYIANTCKKKRKYLPTGDDKNRKIILKH